MFSISSTEHPSSKQPAMAKHGEAMVAVVPRCYFSEATAFDEKL